jgi:hypothetical protein
MSISVIDAAARIDQKRLTTSFTTDLSAASRAEENAWRGLQDFVVGKKAPWFDFWSSVNPAREIQDFEDSLKPLSVVSRPITPTSIKDAEVVDGEISRLYDSAAISRRVFDNFQRKQQNPSHKLAFVDREDLEAFQNMKDSYCAGASTVVSLFLKKFE